MTIIYKMSNIMHWTTKIHHLNSKFHQKKLGNTIVLNLNYQSDKKSLGIILFCCLFLIKLVETLFLEYVVISASSCH